MSALSRFSFDLDAERILAWIALDAPAQIEGLSLKPSHFYDPALRTLFAEGLRLFRLGERRPLMQVGRSFSRETHWFWTDPELDGPQLLWLLWSEADQYDGADLSSLAQNVISLAEARRP